MPVNAYGVAGVLGFNQSWSRVDPMVNLAVDVTPDMDVYAKWGTGYRSGGANSRSLSYRPFGPEDISMFEVGAKTEFWEHRARFNVAAYTGIYKNFQVDFSAPYYSYDSSGNVITTASTTRTTTDTINAPGEGRVSGVETAFTVTPMQGLEFSATYTYAYVRLPATANPFPTYIPGQGMVVSTTPLTIYQEFTPSDAVTGAIDYQKPFEHFTLLTHLDANWDSGSYDTDRDPSPVLKAIKSQPGLVFNGRISAADIALSNGGRLAISLWSRNLFNEQHLYNRTISATTGITGTYNDPRTFGVEANVRF